MAELIRVSYQSVQVIPQEHRFLMHRMYEDNDLDGAYAAEKMFEFIEKEAGETFVAVMANDSVSPPCAYVADEHFPCDYYDEYWYTVLVSKKIWDEYEERIKARDQEWKDAHQCKLVEAERVNASRAL